MSDATARISRRGTDRLRAGHVWIYVSDVEDLTGVEPGSVVSMFDRSGHFWGRAFYSAASKIALRRITSADEPIDREFFAGRLKAAIDARERMLSGPTAAARLVHGESDGIPGLVVDRYADVVCVQTMIQATDRRRDLFFDLLVELIGPRAVVERNDGKAREYEALEKRSGVVRGALDGPVWIDEGAVRLAVDPVRGQKTGAFLDQRENHLAAGSYVRPGDRCLDVFTFNGGFALQMARAGGHVTGVDASADALAAARSAATANGLEACWVEANAFDWLKAQTHASDRYDMIVLDPPAFARSRDALAGALRGYKEINLRALQILAPGGWLMTCSCSHNLSEAQLLDLVLSAGNDAGRALQLVERRGASRDHPVRLGVPETSYLKCLVLRCLD